MRSRSNPRSFACVVLLTVAAAATTACSSDGFGKPRNPPRLVVEIDASARVGSLTAPLDLKVGVPLTFKVRVRALAAGNGVDTTFSRYVRISAKPGAVGAFTGPDVDGRNVLLKNGESITVDVSVTNAYGTTYIVADDLGYVPADPLRQPPPACSNGIDDNGNGLIDFPADPGCAFANDDSEDGGTYAEGASAPIFFRYPRIADIRGLQCSGGACSGNGKTPYSREQIQIDTGWHQDNTYAFSTVVTRLAANGFYATDLGDRRGGFSSVFAFNFNAPPRMRICDRLKTYGGTAGEFFGFTQVSYPTWTLEDWDPAKRPCLVPAPERLDIGIIDDAAELLRRSAGLVRVETAPDRSQRATITPKFGPGDAPKGAGTGYAFGPDATNCDFDKNGKINSFNPGDPEGECATQCTGDPGCTEYSNFATRGTFRITVSDANGRQAAIQADASAASGFDPLAQKGKDIRSMTGTMSFFSGGAQYTIEARCLDDIVVDLASGPFPSDTPCAKDDDCTVAAGLPPGFTCRALGNPDAGKACRKVAPPKVAGDPPSIEPPPLACVFPRTFLDNNPQ